MTLDKKKRFRPAGEIADIRVLSTTVKYRANCYQKTLRFLDKNCRSRKETLRKFTPSYLNVRSTLKKST